jgi:hypothetical protein
MKTLAASTFMGLSRCLRFAPKSLLEELQRVGANRGKKYDAGGRPSDKPRRGECAKAGPLKLLANWFSSDCASADSELRLPNAITLRKR